jgi:hypothetical protein
MKKTFLSASAIVAVLAMSAPRMASAQEAQPASPPTARAAVAAPLTTSGFLTKTYSVIVNVNGTLALGPAGATSDDFACATCGIFEVIFPSPVNECVYTATIGDAAADAPAAGLVNVTRRATTVNGVFVQTFNANGVKANHPFHLMVQC